MGARGEAGLPHAHVHDEGQHEDVRKRQPDAAELGDAGPFGVEDAAGYGEVRYRVSVEQ